MEQEKQKSRHMSDPEELIVEWEKEWVESGHK